MGTEPGLDLNFGVTGASGSRFAAAALRSLCEHPRVDRIRLEYEAAGLAGVALFPRVLDHGRLDVEDRLAEGLLADGDLARRVVAEIVRLLVVTRRQRLGLVAIVEPLDVRSERSLVPPVEQG